MAKNSDQTIDLQEAAKAIAERLPEKTGFILLASPFGEEGRLTYVSNMKREDAVNVLKEWLIKCSAQEDWMKDL